MPLEPLRRMASSGARGLVGVGFGLKPGDPAYEEHKTEFLTNYQAALYVHSRLFDGIDTLLEHLTKTSTRDFASRAANCFLRRR